MELINNLQKLEQAQNDDKRIVLVEQRAGADTWRYINDHYDAIDSVDWLTKDGADVWETPEEKINAYEMMITGDEYSRDERHELLRKRREEAARIDWNRQIACRYDNWTIDAYDVFDRKTTHMTDFDVHSYSLAIWD